MNVFFYGTLRDPDVRRHLFGYDLCDRSLGLKDLKGYQVVYVKHAVYPGLRRVMGAIARGEVFGPLSEVELATLGAYEGACYDLKLLSLDGESVGVYLFNEPALLTKVPWSLALFLRDHKTSFLEMLRSDTDENSQDSEL